MNVATPVLNTLALCAGVGMLDEGLRAGCEYLGIRSRVLAYVERDSYAATTLLARMDEQSLEPAPVWCGDLERFPCGLVRGRVDCVVAGFPCQPWSAAGAQRGTDDARWLWPAIARIVRETESPLCWLENVSGLISGGGLEHVLFELARLGFDAEWIDPEAAEVGASHERKRVFILAVSHSRGRGVLRQSSWCHGQLVGSDSAMGNTERARANVRCTRSGSRDTARESGIELADSDSAGRGEFVSEREIRDGEPIDWNDPDRCDTSVGNTEGIERRAEQQARGSRRGRAGFAGAGEQLADACCAERRPHDEHNKQTSGWQQAADRLGCDCRDVADASSSRSEGREQPGSHDSDGRSTNHANQLPNFVMILYSHPAQPMPDGETSSESAPDARPRLNPVFVCWLMGWPSHWTRAEPISSGAQETALWRSKLQQHLSCLLDE